jgi:DNA-binding transcriptional LysR family regulator
MELAALRDFVTVVGEGSMSGAARALGQPKSTLSRRIQMLEDELGVRLLERTTRAIRLTAEGALLHGRAQRLVLEADELRRAVSGHDTEPRGPLRVACSVLFGQVFMGAIAADYVRRWPQTTLDVVFTDRAVDLVEEGFDCAIRATDDTDSTLISRTFARARGLIVASPDFAARHGGIGHPDSLSGIPCIAFAPMGEPLAWPFAREGQTVLVRPVGPLQLGGMSAVREAALAGAGAAAVPEFLVADDLATGRLVRMLPDWTSSERALRLVYPAGRHLSVRVRAFLDLVVARFAQRRLS